MKWWYRGGNRSQALFADGGERERIIQSPSKRRRNNNHTRKPVTLIARWVTTQKSKSSHPKNKVTSSKSTASEKLTENCKMVADILPVYLLQPLPCNKKRLFKCLQVSLLLGRPFPIAMKRFPSPFFPVSGTTGPNTDFHNRTPSNLKFLSSTQLNFKTK